MGLKPPSNPRPGGPPMAGSTTGQTGSINYVYAWTIFNGTTEMESQFNFCTSSPSYPWSESQAQDTLKGNFTAFGATTVGNAQLSAVSASFGASAGTFTFDPSNDCGGFTNSGAVWTERAGEKVQICYTTPNTPTTNEYQLATGEIFIPGNFGSGNLQIDIVQGPGQWPNWGNMNCSGTVAPLMTPIFADIGSTLNQAGMGSQESLTNNWTNVPV